MQLRFRWGHDLYTATIAVFVPALYLALDRPVEWWPQRSGRR